MRHKLTSILLFISSSFLFTSCFTASKVFNTKSKAPIYLHTPDASKYTFYVNEKEVPVEMVLYDSKEVSRTATTITVEHTYLPALPVDAKKAYSVLKIVKNGTKQEMEILLKTDVRMGAKLVMYFQGMFTMGIGNFIDLTTNSIYAWPEVDID